MSFAYIFVKIKRKPEVDKINALKSIWDGFDFTYLLNILLSVIPALVCITLHELSHGFVAYKLGDDTAKNAGRLTLNPIKHLGSYNDGRVPLRLGKARAGEYV